MPCLRMPSEDPLKVRSWYCRYTEFGKELVINLCLDFSFNF